MAVVLPVVPMAVTMLGPVPSATFVHCKTWSALVAGDPAQRQGARGAQASSAPVPEVRRLLIGRSRYYVYWEVDVASQAVTITRAPSGLCPGGRGRLARIRALADLSERPDKMPEVERLRENIVHLELLANGVARKTDRGDYENRDAA